MRSGGTQHPASNLMSVPVKAPGTDEKLVGKYIVLGQIAQGGFGMIYRVRSLSKSMNDLWCNYNFLAIIVVVGDYIPSL